MRFLFLFTLFCCSYNVVIAQSATTISKWKQQAQNVLIRVDEYGVPHIHGKRDADAVFGLMYVQCAQNFARVERNYLEVFGRLAEVEGENAVWSDLQMQMIYDTSEAKRDYQRAPQWLKDLCQAFADGINYYLFLHPQTKPAVFKQFEPWFPLMYTDGSISATQTGGLNVRDTRELYQSENRGDLGKLNIPVLDPAEPMPLTGSNGFAVAPSHSATGESMLYINPHVTFYFRTEVHMSSDEGLNVYGGATWGNFFIYQGFNEHCGWMHTSSYADVADLYEEKIEVQGNKRFYMYEGKRRPLIERKLAIPYIKNGVKSVLNVTSFRTHHGPVAGSRNGKWLSLKERNRSLEALMQSWLRTKATGLKSFGEVMNLRSNNSNNTVYADKEGNIAYWHGNFVPIRDTNYNWALPVDGSTAATEWKGVHPVAQTIHLINPGSGWVQNCNSTPFTAAGAWSPKRSDYPEYMGPDGENPRALNAVRLLSAADSLDLFSLMKLGYDRHLTAFDILLPSMLAYADSVDANDTQKAAVNESLQYLRLWNRDAAAGSIATTVAIEWATQLMGRAPRPQTDRQSTNLVGTFEWINANVSGREKLLLLSKVLRDLERTYGTWRMPWGDINRYQRNENSTNSGFDDKKWSLPVSLASASWGCLPSFNSRRSDGTLRRYGYSGNSFVAAVKFGKRVEAYTITTGGASFDPNSLHFTDQAEGFINGVFKKVRFYEQDIKPVKSYRPGEEKSEE